MEKLTLLGQGGMLMDVGLGGEMGLGCGELRRGVIDRCGVKDG